jgi:hypothetical protein
MVDKVAPPISSRDYWAEKFPDQPNDLPAPNWKIMVRVEGKWRLHTKSEGGSLELMQMWWRIARKYNAVENVKVSAMTREDKENA